DDGATDLVVTLEDKAILYRNAGKGKFEKVAEFSGGPAALFVDFDHDGLLDLLAGSHLYRNKGNGTFADVTTASKIAPGKVRALAATDYDNHRDVDLVAAYEERDARLYSNHRDGSFAALSPWPVDATKDASAI